MKTDVKTKKTFDAVAFMRKRRDEISKEIEGVSAHLARAIAARTHRDTKAMARAKPSH